MLISASLGTHLGLNRRGPGSGSPCERAEAPAAQHPLPVPVQNDAPAARASFRVRPSAPLLAQLVAVAEDLPAARARRRTDPGAGAAAYRLVGKLGPQSGKLRTHTA